jgi:hypothetical protein
MSKEEILTQLLTVFTISFVIMSTLAILSDRMGSPTGFVTGTENQENKNPDIQNLPKDHSELVTKYFNKELDIEPNTLVEALKQ